MRVLVTGANGFVGRAVCSHLSSIGTDVVAAVRRESAKVPPDVSRVLVDQARGDSMWDAALAEASGVVHLAARVHVMKEVAANPLEEFRRVNVEGTVRLARRAAGAGIRRFVFVSSLKVNGEERDSPYTPEDQPAPEDAYAQSKWEAEQELRAVERQTGMEVAIVRPPLVYGPGVGANFLKLMETVRKGTPLPFASIRNRRSLVFVGNLADALAACLTRPAAAGQTFLVSDGHDVSTPELIRMVGEAMQAPVRLLPLPPACLRLAGRLAGRQQEIARLTGSLTVDTRAIRQQLEWDPPFSLHDGLAVTAADYWKTHAR